MTTSLPLPTQLRRYVQRVVVEWNQYGVSCHNVFHVVLPEPGSSRANIQHTLEIFAGWLAGGLPPDFLPPKAHQAANVQTIRVIALGAVGEAAEELLTVERLLGLAGELLGTDNLPGQVTGLVHWATETRRNMGRSYVVGLPRSYLSGTDAQSIDVDRAEDIRKSYEGLLRWIDFAPYDTGPGILVVRHYRPVGDRDSLASWTSPITACEIRSRRVCTQRRRLRAA